MGLFFVPFFSILFIALSYADENAAQLYQKAASLFSDISPFPHEEINKVIRYGWKEDNEKLKGILAKNKEAIEEFKKATGITYCDFSFGKAIVKDFSAKVPQHTEEFKLANLVLIEGKLYEKQNKLDSALNNYFAVLKCAKHLGQQKDFTLVAKFGEILIENWTSVSLMGYIKHKEKLTKENLQSLFNVLVSFINAKTGLESAFEEEKEYRKNTLRKLAKIDLILQNQEEEVFLNKFLVEIDKLEDEFTRYQIAAFKENKPEVYEEKVKQLKDDVTKGETQLNFKEKLLESCESFGDWLHYWGKINFPVLAAKSFLLTEMPMYNKMATRYYISTSRLNVLITATAVKLYELKNSKALGDLQELVPAYFEKISEDPFDNFKPLKYVAKETGWLVYSFGPDKQDDHAGLTIDEEVRDLTEAKGDIVFQSF